MDSWFSDSNLKLFSWFVISNIKSLTNSLRHDLV
jgi:hypothetical protein